MAEAKLITDTGIRGFLRWLDEQQPAISKQVKQTLPQQVPDAFSEYHAGAWQVAGLPFDQAQAVAKRSLGMLGADGTSFDLSVPSIDLFGGGSTPPFLPTTPAAPVAVDVTAAANAGGGSSSTTDLIGNLVKGVSSLYLTKQQADIQQQVVNTQLQRAAMGLPPLPTSLSNLGVPQVNVGLSAGTGTLIAVGGGLVLLYLLFAAGRRRA